MLSIAQLKFLADHELTSFTNWALKARVKPSVIYQCRAGRGIAEKHAVRLARVVDVEPAAIRTLLGTSRRAPASRRVA